VGLLIPGLFCASAEVIVLQDGPGISERTLPGDRVAEPRWSGRKLQAASSKQQAASSKLLTRKDYRIIKDI